MSDTLRIIFWKLLCKASVDVPMSCLLKGHLFAAQHCVMSNGSWPIVHRRLVVLRQDKVSSTL